MTLSPADAESLLAQPIFSAHLTHIGEIVAEPTAALIHADGSNTPLLATGWRHAF
jgi:hypothetical protein